MLYPASRTEGRCIFLYRWDRVPTSCIVSTALGLKPGHFQWIKIHSLNNAVRQALLQIGQACGPQLNDMHMS